MKRRARFAERIGDAALGALAAERVFAAGLTGILLCTTTAKAPTVRG